MSGTEQTSASLLTYNGISQRMKPGSGAFVERGVAAYAETVDDFMDENAVVVNTSRWDDVAIVGAGTAFVCSTAAGTLHGGWARGITSGANGDCRGIFGEKLWTPALAGTNMPLTIEARIFLPSVTTAGFNVGFVDARTYGAIPVSCVAAAYTTIPVDQVTWCFDTSATTPLTGIGTKNNVDTAATNGTTPTASVSTILRIEIASNGTATFTQDGTVKGSVANAVTTSVFLAPMVAVFTRAAATRTIDIDYVWVACGR